HSITTNDDERMDIDHDSGLETYEDENPALSQNETSPPFGATTIASRVPLSKF
ncbi:unnamed protein product, partial [Rotaria magnacalcarata]